MLGPIQSPSQQVWSIHSHAHTMAAVLMLALCSGIGSQVLMFKYEDDLLTIRRPGANMAEDFTITIN